MGAVSRRTFVEIASATLGLVVAGGCRASAVATADDGRLFARPRKSTKHGLAPLAPGQRLLGIRKERDATIRIPPTVTASMPLLVLLHGAGGSGAGQLGRVSELTDEAGLIVLAPTSTGGTWDAIRGSFGDDIAMIDRALTRAFDTMPIDPARVVLAGFSDGASYALSAGLINGDLFPRVIAFSPGFIIPGTERRRPHIFISHGTEDQILPYERCGKRLATQLSGRGYDVTFKDFPGGHTIPADVGRAAFGWAASA
jgi:predicted esterase